MGGVVVIPLGITAKLTKKTGDELKSEANNEICLSPTAYSNEHNILGKKHRDACRDQQERRTHRIFHRCQLAASLILKPIL